MVGTATATHRSRDEDVVAGREDALAGKAVKAEATGAQHELSPSNNDTAGQGNCGAGRRRRVLFSREQTIALEEWFRRHSYVSAADRDRLAASLALRPTQVKIWFQNRRYKLKKIRRQLERNHDRTMASLTATSSTAAAAATSLRFSVPALSVHPGDVGHRRTIVQPSVVRRIAVPILVRDGRPCWTHTVRHSEC